MSSGRESSWNHLSEVNRFNLLGQMFRVLFVLLSHIIIVRSLSHSDLRDYSWIAALCIFVQTLFTLGFEQSFSYFFPKLHINGENEKIRELIGFAFKAVFIFSVSVFFLLWAFGFFFLESRGEGNLLNLWVLTILANTLFALSQIPLGALRAEQDFRASIFCEQFLLPGLPFLFVVLVCFYEASPVALITVQGLGYLLTFLISLYLLRTRLKSGKATGGRLTESKESRTWLLYSVPIALMLTTEIIFNWIVLSVSGLVLNDFETSFIGVALRSVQFFTFLSMGITPLIMPKISQHTHEDKSDEMMRIVHKMSLWMSCWSVITAFGIATNRSLVMSIFGEEFMLASGFLLWLLPGAIFEGAFGFIKQASLSVGQNIYGFWVYVVAALFAATACYFLSAEYGIAGALAAGSMGLIFVNMTRVLIFVRRNRISLFSRAGFLKSFVLALFVLVIWITIEKYIEVDHLLLRLVLSVVMALLFAIFAFWKDRDILFQMEKPN